MEKKRSFGLDLVRAAAAVLVLTVHSISCIGFYGEPLTGKCMLLAAVLRMACITGVPLFILLTGYLCVERRWSGSYYRKLVPVLLTYVLAGLGCMLCRMLWLKEPFTVQSFLMEFAAFNAAPYAWYIEMYVGLFLLAPFFNAGWQALDKRGRAALTVTLVGLSAVPAAVNHMIGAALWPDWWQGITPLAYYAVGAWLHEYPIRAKRRWLLLGWAAAVAVNGLWSYLRCYGKVYDWASLFEWNSVLALVQAVLLFSCLSRCEGSRAPAPVRWCVGRVARLSLGIYLISYVPERFIYPPLNQMFPIVHRRILWMPASAALVVLCSCLLAQGIDWTAGGIMKLFPKKAAVKGQDRGEKES